MSRIYSFCGAVTVAVLLSPAFDAQAQQVVNGSFEQDGEFTFAGWKATHSQCFREDSLHDTPPVPGAGDWALKAWWPNVQACLAVAYQLVPEARDGEVWRLSAWARQPVDRERRSAFPTRIYWTTFEPEEDTTDFPALYFPAPTGAVDTTTSTEWVRLSVTDTLRLAGADSVGIVLDPGVTYGAEFLTDWTAFDSVRVERIWPVSTEPVGPERGFLLHQNDPNPFMGVTRLRFEVAVTSHVLLAVYDVVGREVVVLVDGVLPVGEHEVPFDASGLPSGVYFYRMQAGDFVQTKQMVLLK